MGQPSSRLTLVIQVGLLVACPALAADEPASLRDSLAAGEVRLALRYRYEHVEDDTVGDKPARASTLRTTLGWGSAPWRGWSAHLEAENVAAIGPDLYNNRGAGSRFNGVLDRPVVADPALTELNQAFLRYQRGAYKVQLGRQEILIGDQRFVGNVGWRQNHQSFDALTVARDPGGRVKLHYAYLAEVHRIFGDNQPMTSHLLSAEIGVADAVTARLYGYLVDYDRLQDSHLSSLSAGAELTGRRPLAGDAKLLWELEHALQWDAGDNPAQLEAGYLHAMVGAAAGGLTVKLGWEQLEGRRGGGPFRTPLATLHKFNGWADKFLVTPPEGLEDLYLAATGSLDRLGWTAVVHDFSAETSGRDYGRELDLELRYRTPWEQTVALTVALYDQRGFSRDTEKWMLWTTYGF